jgi:pimeloyl-ACP methyl ester carboxylesterase
MGLGTFLDKSFAPHVDLSKIGAQERQAYLDDWKQEGALTAMLNWYRASDLVVPAMDEEARKPAWAHAPFPKVKVPTLVIWGMRDKALLPVQLDGLDDLVDDLTVVRIEDAGHFVPWERPEPVAAAILQFMRERQAPST